MIESFSYKSGHLPLDFQLNCSISIVRCVGYTILFVQNYLIEMFLSTESKKDIFFSLCVCMSAW